MDEKTQVQVHQRNGTTSLFTALAVATGKVTDACYQRHTNVEFLAFLKRRPVFFRRLTGGALSGRRRVLVRTDGAGSTHDFIEFLHRQRVAFSVGFTLPDNTPDLLRLIPAAIWEPATDGGGTIRDGAWVAELTDLIDLTKWPPGMRVIVRKERPHPGPKTPKPSSPSQT